MRRSGADGILSPAISAKAAAVRRLRGQLPAANQRIRVRLSEAAQLSAALATMLRSPATKPMANDAMQQFMGVRLWRPGGK